MRGEYERVYNNRVTRADTVSGKSMMPSRSEALPCIMIAEFTEQGSEAYNPVHDVGMAPSYIRPRLWKNQVRHFVDKYSTWTSGAPSGAPTPKTQNSYRELSSDMQTLCILSSVLHPCVVFTQKFNKEK